MLPLKTICWAQALPAPPTGGGTLMRILIVEDDKRTELPCCASSC